MPAVLKVYGHPNGVDNTQRRQILYGPCTLTGTYPAGGFPLSWTTLTDAATGAVFIPQAGTAVTQPQDATFWSTTGSVFYSYKWDKVSNTLRIAAGATELTTGAAVSADTIEFEAEYVRGY